NLLLILCLIILGIIWEISIKGLSIYFASFFTVAGIALFAQWSVLSNITAGVILFFYFPIKIGTKVQILDGGNKIEGLVLDLTIFSVKLEDSDGNEIYIPNNIAIQKGIVSLK
ncbi:MAG: mechanosensitive ion channel domain-containing protein, partial [Bacteroidota bacterium]